VETGRGDWERRRRREQAEEQRGRGAEGQRARRAEEQRGRGGRLPIARWVSALHLSPSAPQPPAPKGGTMLQDLRYGVRLLLKRPGFSAVAIITIALGIGANTAIFSVVNAVLLRPLPYEEADRLVYLSERNPNYDEMSISYPDFVDWRARNNVFENIGVFNYGSYNLTGSGEPERLRVIRASADLMSALRVRPALGRVFTNEEDRPGAPGVALLGHEFWQRRFGGDANIVNQSMVLNDQPYTVIGVMPAGFRFGGNPDLWVPVGPLSSRPVWMDRDNHPGLRGVARLKPGVSIDDARTDMSAITGQLEEEFPKSNKNVEARVIPLLENYVRDVRGALWILLGAVGLVLLIACANVANLLLARAAGRHREMAVRVAVGASRGRIIRQLLTESILLAIVGGAFGLLLAQWCLDLILAFSARTIPRTTEIALDNRVLLFTAGVAILTGIVFGLAPALQATRMDIQEALKETSRSSTGSRHRLRQSLVVAEVALTLVLVISAGLMIRTFYRLQQVNAGFVDENVLTFSVSLPGKSYPNEHQWLAFLDQVTQKLGALPGVDRVAVASRVPMGNNDWQSGYHVVGEPQEPPGQGPSTEVSIVGPGYFRAMGIPLLQGRDFTEQDNRSGVSEERVRDLPQLERLRAGLRSVIVDEEFARRHWPNQDAIGKQILWGDDPDPITVIGVVGRVKFYRPNEPEGFVQTYFPFLEYPQSDMTFAVKTTLDPEQVVAAARQQVEAVDRNQPIYDVATMTKLRSDSIAPQRFNLLLLGLFAGVALALAVVGIYGVMSYAVTQRTHEVGLRMALGAGSLDVLKLVVGHAMKLALTGVALGLVGAALLTRLMSSLLFGVTPTDPVTFVAVALLLGLVALVASLVPARRAARVDPMVALRCE
jgi:putative ABC transport system permease protein